MSTKPKNYTIRELSAATRVSPPTIRNWIKVGALPPVPFRGAHTVYSEDHLHRIMAIKRLRSDFLTLEEIRRRLSGASSEEIKRIAYPEAPSAPRPTPPEPSYPAETWERVVLLPGLELHVRNEPALRRLAQQIYTYFGPTKK